MMIRKSVPTIAIATTLKCPVEQATAYVHYNLNIGIDHVFLFFDDPEDPAIGNFSGDSRVTVVRCDREYWSKNIDEDFKKFNIQFLVNRQRINATNALKWAREKSIDWISHIDVDELIYTGSMNLKRYLRYTPFQILRFTLLEAVPDQLEYGNIFTETTMFKKPAVNNFPTFLRYPWNSLMLILAKRLGVQSPFRISDRFFRAHTKSKVIVRTDLDIRDMRIHGPLCETRHITYRSKRLYLLHFDSCGFQFWLDRWKFKLSGAAKPKPRRYKQKISVHMNELLSTNPSYTELTDSYKKLHYIEEKDIIVLKRLGLIKEITFSENLFE